MYYDHILLATGFENTVMSQPMIQDLVLHFNALSHNVVSQTLRMN